MIIGSLKEQSKDETRISLTPEVTQKLIAKGHAVLLEKGYGKTLYISDTAYLNTGAKVLETTDEILSKSEIIIQINPQQIQPKQLKTCKLIIADFTDSHTNFAPVKELHLELVPRISVAQPIDILSAQSIVKGYMAAIYALYHAKRIAPQLITGATTIKPIKALVIGAGTTGLEIAAFLKKSGCKVTIADIREEAKNLAASVGAEFSLTSSTDIATILSDKNIIISTVNAKSIITDKDLSSTITHAVVIDTTKQSINLTKTPTDFHFCRNTHFERLAPLTASDLFAHNILNLINIILPKPNTLDLSADYIKPILI
jgi:NAD/NADP transhydrogenase alpha subunit